MNACYAISNGEKLYCLAKNNDVAGLMLEVEHSTLYKVENYSDVFMSSYCLFKRIYDILANAKEYATLKKFSGRIEKICAASWDVATLLSIKTRKSLCGELNSDSEKVIAEYEEYKAVASRMFAERNLAPEWEMKDEDVLFLFNKGRLSFVKDEVEHVVYYGEDKYFTLIYDSGNKAKMITKDKVYQ